MNVFKDVTFKWWEAKTGQWFGIALAGAIFTTWPEFSTWLNRWEFTNWALWILAVLFAAWLVRIWFRQ